MKIQKCPNCNSELDEHGEGSDIWYQCLGCEAQFSWTYFTDDIDHIDDAPGGEG